MSGETNFGQFYGSDIQGVGLNAYGRNYGVYDQSVVKGDWDLSAAAFRKPEAPGVSGSGTAAWNGTFIGIAENMEDPSDRYIMSLVYLRKFLLLSFGGLSRFLNIIQESFSFI